MAGGAVINGFVMLPQFIEQYDVISNMPDGPAKNAAMRDLMFSSLLTGALLFMQFRMGLKMYKAASNGAYVDLNVEVGATTENPQGLKTATDEVPQTEVNDFFSVESWKNKRTAFIDDGYGKEFPQLTPEEGTVIRDYTAEGYESLNDALRGFDKLIPHKLTYEKLLNQALGKLNNYEGVVFRGSKSFNMDLIKSGTYIEEGFLSTSTKKSIAYQFGQKYNFEIISKTGKFIDPISAHQGEMEVLFKSKATFSVLSSVEQYGIWYIKMIEK